MGAYASPYIPGVDDAVGGGGGGLVAAPRLNGALQRSPVGKLMTIPCMKGFITTNDSDGGIGRMTISVAGMRCDRGGARHDENYGEEENAHLSLHERR